MHICLPSYNFSPYQIHKFFQSFPLPFSVRTDWYSETNFLSSTISRSSKISFLFAKLFFVKDCLLFTAKVSDSIDTSFTSPRFLCSQIQIERLNYVERPLEEQAHMHTFDFRHPACGIMGSIQQTIKQVLETKPE